MLEGQEKIDKQANEMLNMAQVNIFLFMLTKMLNLDPIWIQDHVRDAVSGAEAFVAEYAIVATWGNVTFLGISEKDLEKRPVSLLFLCFFF